MSKPRFKLISDKDKAKIILNSTSDGTKTANKHHKKTFNQFLLETNSQYTADSIAVEALPNILENFYASIKRTDDINMQNTSLKSCRSVMNHIYKDILGIGKYSSNF